MTHPVAFIDADILLHRAVSFCDADFDGEPSGDPQQALWHFNKMLDRWLKDVGKTSDYYLVVSPSKNFRHGLYDQYKANRKDIKPHPAFAELKDLVKQYEMTIWEDGIEADDLIGIRVTEDPNTVAVSADKDFATVPCRLFIPASHGRTKGDWHQFTEGEANVNWLRQAMTGDTVDNYKGVPRVGKVKAEKCLPVPEPVRVMWPKVVSMFKAAGLDESNAILMARLARILRAGEYDFDTKEVKLWEPPVK
ncbi:hypothetical protein [Paracoccus sp. (in: a-proteobacteria)]|uniref:hypothetical protein n=1 Tax=Paracoccus sp. TaxID=267 RepID=UPI0026DF301D|nr:hypothetical protein [Paracoccus sp. (in: a-proteobacteria)]MDO5647355.1 hypothetical protein [Paracoccus sp. (in: a-proteobacteria)]